MTKKEKTIPGIPVSSIPVSKIPVKSIPVKSIPTENKEDFIRRHRKARLSMKHSRKKKVLF